MLQEARSIRESHSRRSEREFYVRARQFLRHQRLEAREGRPTYADWSWVVPPLSGATTPLFHRSFENRILKPNFFYQTPAWKKVSAWGASPQGDLSMGGNWSCATRKR